MYHNIGILIVQWQCIGFATFLYCCSSISPSVPHKTWSRAVLCGTALTPDHHGNRKDARFRCQRWYTQARDTAQQWHVAPNSYTDAGFQEWEPSLPLYHYNTWRSPKLLTLFKNIYYIIYVNFLKEGCKFDVSFPLGAEELQALLHQRHPWAPPEFWQSTPCTSPLRSR